MTSYANAGHGTMTGLDLTLDLRPSAKLHYSLTSDLYHIAQTVDVDGVYMPQSLNTHHTKLTVTFTPTAADSLQLQAMLNGKDMITAGTMSGFNMLNLSYSHKLSPRLKLIVTGSDVLNSVRLNELIQTSQFRDRTRITIPGQVVFIGLDYKLGAVHN